MLKFIEWLFVAEHIVMVLAAIWIALLVFYCMYLAAVNLWFNRMNTKKWVGYVFSPIVAIMLALDLIMQMTLFTLLFLDLPQELLVTQRLIRYKSWNGNNWRTKVANYLCTNVLNPFDPTKNHC